MIVCQRIYRQLVHSTNHSIYTSPRTAQFNGNQVRLETRETIFGQTCTMTWPQRSNSEQCRTTWSQIKIYLFLSCTTLNNRVTYHSNSSYQWKVIAWILAHCDFNLTSLGWVMDDNFRKYHPYRWKLPVKSQSLDSHKFLLIVLCGLRRPSRYDL